jgi:hypothetical protein
MKLFTDGFANPKIAKGENQWYSTKILHLAPAKLSGYEVCSSRSPGCTISCLNTAGRGRMSPIQIARKNRTLFFFEDRLGFFAQLQKEITAFVKKCNKEGKRPAIRLNGTSDLIWEQLAPKLFDQFPEVQFYDYTKHAKRCLSGWALPFNYHLTFSKSEKNDSKVTEVLECGKVNVVAVFNVIPTSWNGYSVYNADENDLRFLDPPAPAIGGLKAKGKAKHDKTGFTILV